MGKNYAISGVANEWSLAWAVVMELVGQGHTCHVCCLPRNAKRVSRLLRDLGQPELVYPADAREEGALLAAMREIGERAGRVDGLLHAVAFADVEELERGVVSSSPQGFRLAMDVSVYSLIAMCQGLRDHFHDEASVVGLTYAGAQRAIEGYGIMGVAKAALESALRYAAAELGPRGIRVNAVSPGAVLTPAASAFDGIEQRIERGAEMSPLRRKITPVDVAHAVAYLLSPASSAITGQCLYVDAGLSTLGVG